MESCASESSATATSRPTLSVSYATGSSARSMSLRQSSPACVYLDVVGSDVRLLLMAQLRDPQPGAHELFRALDAKEALETLAFASMLMRRLDTPEVRPPAEHDQRMGAGDLP
jgi:hypothetical protein